MRIASSTLSGAPFANGALRDDGLAAAVIGETGVVVLDLDPDS